MIRVWDNKEKEHGLFDNQAEAYQYIKEIVQAQKEVGDGQVIYTQKCVAGFVVLLDYDSEVGHHFYLKGVDGETIKALGANGQEVAFCVEPK